MAPPRKANLKIKKFGCRSQVLLKTFAVRQKSNKIGAHMAKAELKTKESEASVDAFLNKLAETRLIAA